MIKQNIAFYAFAEKDSNLPFISVILFLASEALFLLSEKVNS